MSNNKSEAIVTPKSGPLVMKRSQKNIDLTSTENRESKRPRVNGSTAKLSAIVPQSKKGTPYMTPEAYKVIMKEHKPSRFVVLG